MGRHSTMPYPWNHLVYYMKGPQRLAEALGVCKTTVYNWARGRSKMLPHFEVKFNRLVKEMEEKYAK